MKSTLLLLAGLTCASTAFAANGTTPTQSGFPPIVVPSAPPARLAEQVPSAPGAGYVWLPGRHTWATDRWQWIPGAWVVPPRPDARWVDPLWNAQTNQWTEGHWQVAGAVAPQVVVPTPAPQAFVAVPTPPPQVRMTNELIVLEPPPPPAEADVQTPPPGPGYVWISGYWGWENGKRQWFRGHWERPPRGYRVWVAPRWEQRPNGYAFVHGYWM